MSHFNLSSILPQPLAFLLAAAMSFAASPTEVVAATFVDLPANGPQPVVITPQGRRNALYEKSYALLISASNYTGGPNGWRPLPESGKELDRVADALRKQGFSVWRVSDPSSAEFTHFARSFMAKFGHESNYRLVFFFSGHGYTNPKNDVSYLVPVDALHPLKDFSDFYEKAVPIETIQTWAKELQVRHALFVFDSCFSGSIFMTKASPVHAEPRGANVSDRWQFLSRKSAQPVRQFIAAGGPREELPAKSIFVPLFIEALSGKASGEGDGFVSGKEIGSWLEQQVPRYSRTQNPHSDVIRVPELSFGDVIFQPGGPDDGTSMRADARPLVIDPAIQPGGTATAPVPPEFKLFGETIRILYVAERKSTAITLEQQLRNMYARVSTQEVWEVPPRFRNRIVSKSSKVSAAKAIEQLTKGTAHLNFFEQPEQREDELVIWLGAP